MKRLSIILMSLFALLATTVMKASGDKPIQPNQLPTTAQEFLKTHFADQKILLAKIDTEVLTKNYEVVLENGTQIDFDGKGRWETVDCGTSAVPTSIIPSAIASYVKATYPDAFVVKIDKDTREYEVELSNRIELTFDKKFNLTDIDR